MNYARFTLSLLIFTFCSLGAMAQETTSTKAYEIQNKDLKAYVGEYTFDKKGDTGFDITISMDGEAKLMAQPTEKFQPLALMTAMSKDKFELAKVGHLIITFHRGEKEKILSLTIADGDQSFTCLRKEEE